MSVRKRGEDRYQETLVQEKVAFGGGSVLVWGVIWHGGRSILLQIEGTVTAEVYRGIREWFFRFHDLPDNAIFRVTTRLRTELMLLKGFFKIMKFEPRNGCHALPILIRLSICGISLVREWLLWNWHHSRWKSLAEQSRTHGNRFHRTMWIA